MAENTSVDTAAPVRNEIPEPAKGAGGPAKPKVILRLGPRELDPEYVAANVPTLSTELAELDAQIAQLREEIDAASGQYAELEAQIAEKKTAFRVAMQRANKIRPIIRRLQVNAGDESIIPTIDARLAEIDAEIKAMKQAKYNEHKNSPKTAWWAQKSELNSQVHPFEIEVERSKLQAQKRRILESTTGAPPHAAPFLQYKVDVEYFPETNDRYFNCPQLPEIPEETGDEKNTMLRYLLKKIADELKKGKHGGVKSYPWNSHEFRNSIHARIGICNLYLQLYAIFQENKQVKVIFSKKHNNALLTKAPGIDGYLMFALGEAPIKNMKSSKTVKGVIDELRAIPDTENMLKAGAMHIYNNGIFQLDQFRMLKEVLNSKGIKMLEKHLYVTRGRQNENVIEVIFSAEPVASRGAGGAAAATSKGGGGGGGRRRRAKTRKR
jgi:hypothetical protein